MTNRKNDAGGIQCLLNSGYKKTSITALRSHWQPVIYVSKLLAANSSQALFLTFFITPLKKLVFSKMH
jgi:hypothetical protein